MTRRLSVGEQIAKLNINVTLINRGCHRGAAEKHDHEGSVGGEVPVPRSFCYA